MSEELRKPFHEKLEEVRLEVVRMSAMVTEMIPRATDAFLNNDLTAASRLIADKDRIDAASVELDTLCMELLALQQVEVVLLAGAFDPLFWMGRAKQLAIFGASIAPAM